MIGFIGVKRMHVPLVDNIGGAGLGGGGGVPNSVFNNKLVFIRDSISEISP